MPGSDGGAVLPGVGPFIFGVVERRVVGDGDDTGALRRRQVLSGLAEVVFRCRLHAAAAAAQIDHIQVQLQNLAFRAVTRRGLNIGLNISGDSFFPKLG